MIRCDSHIHVVGDPGSVSLVPTRTYTPAPAPMAALQAIAAPLGIGRFVIVQPSFYGNDNSITLDAIDSLHGEGRGVAVIDPDATHDGALAELLRRGIRGLRINLYSTLDEQQARPLDQAFTAVAAIAARMGWHVEVLAALPLLARNAALLAASAAPVVFDHFGLYAGYAPDGAEGQALLALLRQDHVWMKLSAPYRAQPDRLATLPDPAWMRAMLDAAPSRCVWGSDWPHTPPHEDQRGDASPLPYRMLDYASVVEGFRQAVGDESLAESIMTSNAARLYGFDGGHALDDIQRSALRKTAWRFVPLLTVAYLFNYLDRTCLGFAALTMNKEIGLSPSQFGFGASIFFLAYSLFEVPSNSRCTKWAPADGSRGS